MKETVVKLCDLPSTQERLGGASRTRVLERRLFFSDSIDDYLVRLRRQANKASRRTAAS
jgi:hypothetical protein